MIFHYFMVTIKLSYFFTWEGGEISLKKQSENQAINFTK